MTPLFNVVVIVFGLLLERSAVTQALLDATRTSVARLPPPVQPKVNVTGPVLEGVYSVVVHLGAVCELLSTMPEKISTAEVGVGERTSTVAATKATSVLAAAIRGPPLRSADGRRGCLAALARNHR